ncbi:hypothetical protein ACLMJK_003755 [Lecanora helva]
MHVLKAVASCHAGLVLLLVIPRCLPATLKPTTTPRLRLQTNPGVLIPYTHGGHQPLATLKPTTTPRLRFQGNPGGLIPYTHGGYQAFPISNGSSVKYNWMIPGETKPINAGSFPTNSPNTGIAPNNIRPNLAIVSNRVTSPSPGPSSGLTFNKANINDSIRAVPAPFNTAYGGAGLLHKGTARSNTSSAMVTIPTSKANAGPSVLDAALFGNSLSSIYDHPRKTITENQGIISTAPPWMGKGNSDVAVWQNRTVTLGPGTPLFNADRSSVTTLLSTLIVVDGNGKPTTVEGDAPRTFVTTAVTLDSARYDSMSNSTNQDKQNRTTPATTSADSGCQNCAVAAGAVAAGAIAAAAGVAVAAAVAGADVGAGVAAGVEVEVLSEVAEDLAPEEEDEPEPDPPSSPGQSLPSRTARAPSTTPVVSSPITSPVSTSVKSLTTTTRTPRSTSSKTPTVTSPSTSTQPSSTSAPACPVTTYTLAPAMDYVSIDFNW